MALVSERPLSHPAKYVSVADIDKNIFDVAGAVVSSISAAFSNAPDSKPTTAKIRAPKLDPFLLDTPGGLLSDIARWVNSTSPSPNAAFSVMSAVAFFAGLHGRRHLTPDGLGLNVYIVLVAGSGFGKDRPIKAVKQLASAIGRKHIVGPNDFASDSALEYILRHQPCLVLPMDEFGMVLSSSGRMADPYSRARRKSLLELYSSSTSEWVAKVRAGDAGKDNRPPRAAIEWPTLSIIAGTTPETFYDGLGDDAFTSGLMARLLIVSVDTPPELIEIDGFPTVPESLSNAIKLTLPDLSSGADNAAERPVKVTTARWQGSDAKARLKEIRKWARDVGIDDPHRGLIVNRAGDFVSKLATLRSISRNTKLSQVTLDDIEWGFAIVLRSIKTIEDGAERFMSGSIFETLCKAILEAVRKCKTPRGLKNAELLRKPGVSSAEPRLFEAALKRLLEGTGQIQNVAGTKLGTGGKGGRYKLAPGVAPD